MAKLIYKGPSGSKVGRFGDLTTGQVVDATPEEHAVLSRETHLWGPHEGQALGTKGPQVLSRTGQAKQPLAKVTSSTALSQDHSGKVLSSAHTGPVTYTLPTNPTVGTRYDVQFDKGAKGAVTVARNGAKIDGNETDLVIPEGATHRTALTWDGQQWVSKQEEAHDGAAVDERGPLVDGRPAVEDEVSRPKLIYVGKSGQRQGRFGVLEKGQIVEMSAEEAANVKHLKEVWAPTPDLDGKTIKVLRQSGTLPLSDNPQVIYTDSKEEVLFTLPAGAKAGTTYDFIAAPGATGAIKLERGSAVINGKEEDHTIEAREGVPTRLYFNGTEWTTYEHGAEVTAGPEPALRK